MLSSNLSSAIGSTFTSMLRFLPFPGDAEGYYSDTGSPFLLIRNCLLTPPAAAVVMYKVTWLHKTLFVCIVSRSLPMNSVTSTVNQFFDPFAKLRKATVNFVMSVCLSVRMKQLGSHTTDLHEVWYLSIFRKTVDKIQLWLNPDKNNGYFT
jgi:hypothetical protein